MQSCFVLSRYKISHNFITPNSFVYHMISLLGLVIVMLIHTFSFVMNHFTNLESSELVYWTLIFNFLFRMTSFLITYILNTTNGLNSIDMIIKIQEAHQIITTPENILKKYTFWNWIHVIIKFPSYTLIFMIFVYFVELLNISKMLYVISVMYFDCNIIYASRLMKLLRIEMICLKENLKKSSEPNTQRKNVSRNKKLCCKKITQAYLDLLSVFDIFKKIFSFPVSNSETKLF